uniref:Secreted protein n=1 Tax=Panagrellus redivivus TaxID=6233 RepID=A0A7E4USE8_PANRE
MKTPQLFFITALLVGIVVARPRYDGESVDDELFNHRHRGRSHYRLRYLDENDDDVHADRRHGGRYEERFSIPWGVLGKALSGGVLG